MGQPLLKDMGSDNITLDPTAEHRIDQVRLRRFAFHIQKFLPALGADDVEALAVAMLEASDEVKNPTGRDLFARLLQHGHSAERANMLVAAIGLQV